MVRWIRDKAPTPDHKPFLVEWYVEVGSEAYGEELAEFARSKAEMDAAVKAFVLPKLEKRFPNRTYLRIDVREMVALDHKVEPCNLAQAAGHA